ncbi:hypothetical protein QTP70_017142 [Hemibagrus guttatus]|uniref:Ig-like domain-containing protein n=1 Tax=Hemibagrus guttatus TaxID=175788 RepID=A0AAE0UHX2_9TELE|nr:hypothetical protein QTP70_017142 [Hemibagrus guttatus]
MLGVSSGRRKEDKETWWWNEEVHDSIQRKRLAKKKWDMDRTEENRQEYKELQRRVKREVSKAKQKAYEELYTRLDTREGEKDLYRLARQRDRDGKDVQQVRVIKDRDGRVLTSEESVQRGWKEYFEELMNEENEREKRVEGVNSVEQKVDKIRKDEVRKALKRMKSGKAVGPDDILVEVWKCLGEAAVEFVTDIMFFPQLTGDSMADSIKPLFTHKAVDEGDDVTLSCSYKLSGVSVTLHWYRQYPTSNPEFLLYIDTSGFKSDPIPPRLNANVDKNMQQVDLIISSAAVSDSALYYCALQPTVTGNPAALYKNSHSFVILNTVLLVN